MGRIVVGVDGSENARRALRWAIGEGRLRGDSVEAVHACHPPYAGYAYTVVAFDPGAAQATGRAVLDAAVAGEDATGLPEPVKATLVEGAAAPALLDAAKDADLLVVGARGHGGFVGLLMGSVSQQVAHHAPCPVVIVPPEE